MTMMTTTTTATTTTSTTSLSRRRTTGCNKWQRTINLGNASRKERKFSSFCRTSKRGKKKKAPHINQDSLPLPVLLSSTEIFYLLVEQTNFYYHQHFDGQAGPSCRLPDIMTFIASALQKGHELKDILHDYWSRLRQLHIAFTERP